MEIEPPTPTVQSTVPSSPPLYRVIFLYYFVNVELHFDRLCGLVVRVSGYRYRGPGFDPRRYQIF